MSTYAAPLQDMRFVIKELIGLADITAMPDCAEVTSDLVDAVLEEAGKFAAEVLDPLNRGGDRQGAQWAEGKVSAAPGFKQAYQQFVAAGWNGFQAMFADSVETYSRERLPLSEPTHPQAEVLIHGSVDLASVQAIYVPHRTTLLEVARLCERHARPIPIHIAPHLFVWPARLAKNG